MPELRTRIGAIALAAIALPALAAAEGGSVDARDAFGPLLEPARELRAATRPAPPGRGGAAAAVLAWNRIAIDASGLDHTPVAPGEDRVFGENLGPGRSGRAMAIVHVAIFEAVNAIAGRHRSYTGMPRARGGASIQAAVATAAHDTLVALYPSQVQALDARLAEALDALPSSRPRADGTLLGRRAAAAILALRADDGSQHKEPRVGIEFQTSDEPGRWRPDPISQIPLALGAHWGDVLPFALDSADQFRVPPPPALDSDDYAAAFDEVKRLGGDGAGTETERSKDQGLAGIYWAYDGTPSLCAPTRLYNQIAVQIARERRTDAVELARLLALVNVAMADAGIAIWESKYHYEFWRPVTGIREADPETGPSGAGDGNPATHGDPEFSPLGAPASNLMGPNFTPPFPAYPSGHAGFGGALFQTLRRFYRTDRIAFTFTSDELDGRTLDHQGEVRPLAPRRFASLSKAEEENGQSRIYLGIHWAFDKTAGIAQGREVADQVFDRLFVPLSKRSERGLR